MAFIYIPDCEEQPRRWLNLSHIVCIEESPYGTTSIYLSNGDKLVLKGKSANLFFKNVNVK